MKLSPKGPRVFVEQFDLEGTSKAGIVIPLGKGNYRLGKVLQIGDGVLTDGTVIDAPCAAGDTILYTKYFEFVLADQTVNVVTFDEVIATVKIEEES